MNSLLWFKTDTLRLVRTLYTHVLLVMVPTSTTSTVRHHITIANGNQGREQYGPQRYLYINIIDKVRAQQIASEHFKQGKPRKRKSIDENSDSD